jgi:serine/threonine protein phosphatase PrpC
MSDQRSDDLSRPGLTPYFESQNFPPPSALVHPRFGACSRLGRFHAVNEDHYLITRVGRSQETLLTSLPDNLVGKRFDEEGFAMVVADGLGNSGAGEAASRAALVTLIHLILNFCKWNLRIDDRIAEEIMDRAERFFRHVDSAVVYEGTARGWRQPQTTLTAVFGAGRDLFFAHVGHSRAYLFRDRSLVRLTRDHTVARRGESAPLMPLVDVNTTTRDLGHIVTETIGKSGSVGPRIDLERFRLVDGDRILVCTNGITDLLDESVIASVLDSGASPDDESRRLVDLAMEAGGDDDATALVAEFKISS